MEDYDKILFLESLIDQASNKLKKLGCRKTKFFLVNDGLYQFFELGIDGIGKVKKLDEKTGATFSLFFALGGNSMLEKSSAMQHSIKAVINRWKKTKKAEYEDILLQIVHSMENAVEHDNYSIGLEMYPHIDGPAGIILWHANMPIEQLAIDISMRGDL